MSRTKLVACLLVFLISLSSVPQVYAQDHPKRLRREDSFLGIHFDFHANNTCTEIGKNVTREMIEIIIDQVHPDYIQCDCKGHQGISSYPTKVGNPAPGFVRVQLRIWRDVTAERGVALYVHYSGVWDDEAVKNHPEWARIDENGKPDNRLTSVFGPYVDELLIPQLKELNDEYQIDGVWIDGDVWAVEPDYGKRALELFRNEKGIDTVPRKPEDTHYFEFLEFNREHFRRYVNHYVTELHRHNPGFQIATNWANSSFMPEKPSIAVDFISGDNAFLDNFNRGRYEARCLVHQGKPWDVMSWGFSYDDFEHGNRSTKSIQQLQREAAGVIALGGSFQAYFSQKKDGSIYEWQMKLMGEVAKFCRARQQFCFKAKPVPQIAVLLSSPEYYKSIPRVFGVWDVEPLGVRGALQCLLDSQYSVDIVMEHHLTGRMSDYPLIVIPEWDSLDESFSHELLAYVRSGGNLLLIGPKTAALFEDELGIKLIDDPLSKTGTGLSTMAGLEESDQPLRKLSSAMGSGLSAGCIH